MFDFLTLKKSTIVPSDFGKLLICCSWTPNLSKMLRNLRKEFVWLFLLNAMDYVYACVDKASICISHLVPNPVYKNDDYCGLKLHWAGLKSYIDIVADPLAFFSCQLRHAEEKYSTFDRELLCLYLAIRHFRFVLEGRKFTAYTDHKPLVQAISKSTEPCSVRQQRQLAHISEFTTDVRHVRGKANVVADCLSRLSLNNVSLGIDYTEKAKAQSLSKEIQPQRTAVTGLKIVSLPLSDSNPDLTILCTVMYQQDALVP